jgi:diamine N-acetyltransferase
MSITLQALTQDSWRACVALDAGPTGRTFIPSNLYALAESKFSPSFVPLGIYADTLLIGFVMYNSQPESDGSYYIYSMMIDARYQRKGYGKAALRLIIDRMRQLPHCETITLEYDRENKQAARFYNHFGFQEEAGSLTGGQIARLHLL